ncbi:MAG: twin-arginine translocation signal domain-containing protein, partial [Thermoguttaceae bacterium]|nr:twin-arginine translocation signal domain-containing protein [Thermoguttaceae bacterium]
MKSTQRRVGRRDFLKGCAVAGAAALVPTYVPGKVLGLDG